MTSIAVRLTCSFCWLASLYRPWPSQQTEKPGSPMLSDHFSSIWCIHSCTATAGVSRSKDPCGRLLNCAPLGIPRPGLSMLPPCHTAPTALTYSTCAAVRDIHTPDLLKMEQTFVMLDQVQSRARSWNLHPVRVCWTSASYKISRLRGVGSVPLRGAPCMSVVHVGRG